MTPELKQDLAKTGAGLVFVVAVALMVEPLGRVATFLLIGLQKGLFG